MNLRQRIRKNKISCQPWKQYKSEIKLLPISAQCLFSNTGIPWDIIEIELKEEGWLYDEENLWEVLMNNELNRKLEYQDIPEPFDDSWTDEDYINFYENL